MAAATAFISSLSFFFDMAGRLAARQALTLSLPSTV